MPHTDGMSTFVTKTPAERLQILEALEEAMSSGAYSIAHEGKTITFRTLSEMTLLHSMLCRSLNINPNAAAAAKPRILRGVLRVR
ncbi:hypothetical protein PARHAE_03263 [Paracoccus haematequi]|uniref:Uncharacterized protein n=2 Tax=Paracoccus haematequi TaxID=2491866 RepID=A0A447IRD7_9RHOB|nr:hypothetical protein PARHAE_03263 [Paracoccus haematequi]